MTIRKQARKKGPTSICSTERRYFVYALIFDYLILIISLAQELTLLGYVLIIALLWCPIFFSDSAILDVCFSPGHHTDTARGRQADEGPTESLLVDETGVYLGYYFCNIEDQV
jgi:hypothetical protein